MRTALDSTTGPSKPRLPPTLYPIAAAVVAAACAPGGQAVHEPTPRTAAAVVDSVLETPPLDHAHFGIAVVDARTGDPVLRRNAEKMFITASNMKLVTVAAALALLGPDHRFRTEVVAPAGADGTAERVIVKGSGDPTLSSSFRPRPLAPLDSLADSLYAAGLRRVEGPVVVDQSLFGPPLVHPAWEVFDVDWYYAAPVTPLAVAEAAVPIVVRPGPVGAPAEVEVFDLPGLVGLDAEILTVEGDRSWNDVLQRFPHTDSLVLGGTIGVDAGADSSWIAQTDPGRLAGRALLEALRRAGIEVVTPAVVVHQDTLPYPAASPAGGGDVRAAWTSPPLRDVVHLPLSESDNWVTEQLLRTLGAEVAGDGGWSASTRVVETFLADSVGAPEGSLYMRDGSGLSAQNLVTPDAMVALLRYVDRQPWAEVYREALARPGREESTLENRLLRHEGRIAAKTGTIRHVNALSGYATTSEGREVVFSILSNASALPSSRVRSAIDVILETILEGGS